MSLAANFLIAHGYTQTTEVLSGSVSFDSSGNLYGTTNLGGIVNWGSDGCGVVYTSTPNSRRSVLGGMAKALGMNPRP
jgi:hypothetical protein